jgi:hypothetical protein
MDDLLAAIKKQTPVEVREAELSKVAIESPPSP